MSEGAEKRKCDRCTTGVAEWKWSANERGTCWVFGKIMVFLCKSCDCSFQKSLADVQANAQYTRKKLTGFALLSPHKRAEVAGLAGLAARRSAKTHRFTPEEARNAARARFGKCGLCGAKKGECNHGIKAVG